MVYKTGNEVGRRKVKGPRERKGSITCRVPFLPNGTEHGKLLGVRNTLGQEWKRNGCI